jgi:hypothetical protein
MPIRSSRLAGAALFLAAFAANAVPALAVHAGSVSETSRNVTATLSWKAGHDYLAEKPTLTIERAGVTLLSGQDLTEACQLCTNLVQPRNALHVRDVNGDGEPDVLVDLFSGGAHCCSSTVIEVLNTGGTAYQQTVASWLNGFYRLRDLDGDGQPEFVTDDERFAYLFTSYAESWRPPMVLELRGHTLRDRTTDFPKLVRKDLLAIDDELPKLVRQGGDPRGLVGARVADMYLDGLDSQVEGYFAYARREHWIGRHFRARVLKTLHKLGYR